MMKPRYILSFIALLLGSLATFHHSLSSQTPPRPTPTLQGDAARPPQTQNWLDTHLYFGLGPIDTPEKGITETVWLEFLDKEVTPRFPSGLSVVDIYGQWQGRQQTMPERERSKMLIIDYPATAGNAARIEAIRAAWKPSGPHGSSVPTRNPSSKSLNQPMSPSNCDKLSSCVFAKDSRGLSSALRWSGWP